VRHQLLQKEKTERGEMDLFHVLLNIDQFSEENTLYVQLPWTLESETQVIFSPDEERKIIKIDDQLFEYFLDVSQVDALFVQLAHHHLCLRDQCQHMIEFAINLRQLK